MRLRSTRRSAVAACLAFVFCAVAPGPAVAQDVIRLKLSHFLPDTHGMHMDFMEPWARDLERCTDDRVQVTVYPAGSAFGSITRQLDQVRAGVVDIAHGLSGLPRGNFLATSVIELPFMVETADVATRTLWQLYQEGYFGDEYKGLKVLALHAHNPGLFHTQEVPIDELSDMEGLRIRTPSPSVSMMLEYLGASPVGMPPLNTYQALLKGTLDGTVFPWDAIGAFNLNEVLQFHTDARAYTTSFYFVMNQHRYESLPTKVRQCIDSLSGETLIRKFGDWWNQWDAPGRKEAIALGHTIIPVSDEQRAQWKQKLEPMIQARLDDLKEKGVENVDDIYTRAQELIEKFEAECTTC